MKKFNFILLLLFLSVGCTKVEYTLTLSDDGVSENIEIPYIKNTSNENKLKELKKIGQTAYYSSSEKKEKYYHISIKEKKKQLLLTYDYKYDINNVINSEAINYCFYQKDIIYEENSIIIKTGQISCLQDEYGQLIDELIINIVLPKDYKNVQNNADQINGNKYTWKFNNDNSNEHYIYFEIEKQIPKIDNDVKFNDNSLFYMFLIIGFVVLIILISYAIGKKNNKL